MKEEKDTDVFREQWGGVHEVSNEKLRGGEGSFLGGEFGGLTRCF